MMRQKRTRLTSAHTSHSPQDQIFQRLIPALNTDVAVVKSGLFSQQSQILLTKYTVIRNFLFNLLSTQREENGFDMGTIRKGLNALLTRMGTPQEQDHESLWGSVALRVKVMGTIFSKVFYESPDFSNGNVFKNLMLLGGNFWEEIRRQGDMIENIRHEIREGYQALLADLLQAHESVAVDRFVAELIALDPHLAEAFEPDERRRSGIRASFAERRRALLQQHAAKVQLIENNREKPEEKERCLSELLRTLQEAEASLFEERDSALERESSAQRVKQEELTLQRSDRIHQFWRRLASEETSFPAVHRFTSLLPDQVKMLNILLGEIANQNSHGKKHADLNPGVPYLQLPLELTLLLFSQITAAMPKRQHEGPPSEAYSGGVPLERIIRYFHETRIPPRIEKKLQALGVLPKSEVMDTTGAGLPALPPVVREFAEMIAQYIGSQESQMTSARYETVVRLFRQTLDRVLGSGRKHYLTNGVTDGARKMLSYLNHLYPKLHLVGTRYDWRPNFSSQIPDQNVHTLDWKLESGSGELTLASLLKTEVVNILCAEGVLKKDRTLTYRWEKNPKPVKIVFFPSSVFRTGGSLDVRTIGREISQMNADLEILGYPPIEFFLDDANNNGNFEGHEHCSAVFGGKGFSGPMGGWVSFDRRLIDKPEGIPPERFEARRRLAKDTFERHQAFDLRSLGAMIANLRCIELGIFYHWLQFFDTPELLLTGEDSTSIIPEMVYKAQRYLMQQEYSKTFFRLYSSISPCILNAIRSRHNTEALRCESRAETPERPITRDILRLAITDDRLDVIALEKRLGVLGVKTELFALEKLEMGKEVLGLMRQYTRNLPDEAKLSELARIIENLESNQTSVPIKILPSPQGKDEAFETYRDRFLREVRGRIRENRFFRIYIDLQKAATDPEFLIRFLEILEREVQEVCPLKRRPIAQPVAV